MWGKCFTNFLLLFLPGWIEQPFSLPFLFLFHVVVHRIVVSILVHGCWHNPLTADRQRRLRRGSKRRDVDQDRRLRSSCDLPTSLPLQLLLRRLSAVEFRRPAARMRMANFHGSHSAQPSSAIDWSAGSYLRLARRRRRSFRGG